MPPFQDFGLIFQGKTLSDFALLRDDIAFLRDL